MFATLEARSTTRSPRTSSKPNVASDTGSSRALTHEHAVTELSPGDVVCRGADPCVHSPRRPDDYPSQGLPGIQRARHAGAPRPADRGHVGGRREPDG